MPKITRKPRPPKPLEVNRDRSPSEIVAARDTRSNFGKMRNAGEMMVADEKRETAMKMRKEGAGIQEIADTLEVSIARASTYCTELWAPQILNLAQLQVDRTNLQLQDIETIRSRLMPFLMSDELTIIDIQEKKTITLDTFEQLCRITDRLIKLMDHEAKLLRITQAKDDTDIDSGKRTLDRETLTLVYTFQRQHNAIAEEKMAEAHEVA